MTREAWTATAKSRSTAIAAWRRKIRREFVMRQNAKVELSTWSIGESQRSYRGRTRS
jgi:hypothetical protein